MARPWVPRTFAGVLVVVVLYGVFRAAASSAPPRVEPGAVAPPFSAVTLDATPKSRTIADYRGSPVLLNVWATWCDPCREEMPSMQRLYDAYRDRGLKVVAVSIDDAGNEQLIRDFASEHRLTFDILHDARSAIMTTYQVRGVPQSFLIATTGRIRGTRFVADWSSAESRELIEKLLSTPEGQE